MDAGGGGRAFGIAGDAGVEDRAMLEVQAGGREVVACAIDVAIIADSCGRPQCS